VVELDLSRLRTIVDRATRVPDFAGVVRRAEQLRHRHRLRVYAAALVTTAMMMVPGTYALRQEQRPPNPDPLSAPLVDPAGPDPLAAEGGYSSPPDAPVVATVVAAAGADLGHTYALIDVCRSNSCDLQLWALSAAGLTGTPPSAGMMDLLRTAPNQRLDHFELRPVTDSSLLVGARFTDGVMHWMRADLGPAPLTARAGMPTAAGSQPAGNSPAAQLSAGGPVYLVSVAGDSLSPLTSQPPLADPLVVPVVPGGAGIWVTGGDPATRQPRCAVSSDLGLTWRSAALPGPPGSTPLSITVANLATGYVLARLSTGGIALAQTADAGGHWTAVPTDLAWVVPAVAQAWSGSGDVGLVRRPDGALLAWRTVGAQYQYAVSSDGGRHFVTAAGPGGPIVAIGGGYVSLGVTPKVSLDAITWRTAMVGYVPPA
jgi:hypothetical protein